MRIIQHDNGQWQIDNDEDVLKMVYVYDGAGKVIGTAIQIDSGPIDLNASYWQYIVRRPLRSKEYDDYPGEYNEYSGQLVPVGQWFRVDVSNYKPDLQTLTELYDKALKAKRPEWGAAYLQHKTRVLQLLSTR